MTVSVKRAVGGMSVINALAMVGATAQAIVVARAFGTERVYDLYLLVAVLPELITIFTQNLFAALILPLFHKLETEGGEEHAWREIWAVANVNFLLYALATAGLMVFARPVAALLVRDATAGEVAYAAAILRVFAPAVALSLILRIFLSLHNAKESFVFPATTNLIPPAFVTASVLLFGERWGPYAIAAGAVAACAGQIILLTTRVITKGFRYWRPRLNLRSPAVPVFFGWAAPLLVGAGAEQMASFIDRQVAATLRVEGAIAALKYGVTLANFTIAFFSVPLARVTFTYLSRDAARAAREEINARFNLVLRQLLIFYIPASLGLFLLREPIIRFLYMGGRFDAASLALAKPAVAAYAAGLAFLVAMNLVRYVAYSYKRYFGYSVIAAGAVAATYVVDRLLAAAFGYWGIGLARGAVACLWAAATFTYLRRTEGLTLGAPVAATLGRCFLAAGPMTLLVWWLGRTQWGLGGPPRFEPFVAAVIAALGGGIIYFGLLWLLREGEVVNLGRAVLAKAKRQRVNG